MFNQSGLEHLKNLLGFNNWCLLPFEWDEKESKFAVVKIKWKRIICFLWYIQHWAHTILAGVALGQELKYPSQDSGAGAFLFMVFAAHLATSAFLVSIWLRQKEMVSAWNHMIWINQQFDKEQEFLGLTGSQEEIILKWLYIIIDFAFFIGKHLYGLLFAFNYNRACFIFYYIPKTLQQNNGVFYAFVVLEVILKYSIKAGCFVLAYLFINGIFGRYWLKRLREDRMKLGYKLKRFNELQIMNQILNDSVLTIAMPLLVLCATVFVSVNISTVILRFATNTTTFDSVQAGYMATEILIAETLILASSSMIFVHSQALIEDLKKFQVKPSRHDEVAIQAMRPFGVRYGTVQVVKMENMFQFLDACANYTVTFLVMTSALKKS